jgi:hypothetical protein
LASGPESTLISATNERDRNRHASQKFFSRLDPIGQTRPLTL